MTLLSDGELTAALRRMRGEPERKRTLHRPSKRPMVAFDTPLTATELKSLDPSHSLWERLKGLDPNLDALTPPPRESWKR